MKRIKRWAIIFVKSLQLQLFVSFISLPFLVGWGLPVSIFTPVSTLVFGPFLTIFLLLSSLIFFLELVYLPNSFLLWLLEKVTYYWELFLSYEHHSWLIAFKKPPSIILFFIPFIAVAIIHCKKVNHFVTHFFLLVISLFGVCCVLKYFPFSSSSVRSEIVTCKRSSMTLIVHDGETILIDAGCLSAQASFESMINYTLIPTIIQKTGSLHIDHIVVKKINERIFRALCFLASKVTIHNVYMPHWKGKLPYYTYVYYNTLQKQLALHGGTITQLSSRCMLVKTNTDSFFLDLHPKQICYYNATYNSLVVESIHHNHVTTVKT